MVNNTFLSLIAEAILSRADGNLNEIPQFTKVAALEQKRKKYSNCLNSATLHKDGIKC